MQAPITENTHRMSRGDGEKRSTPPAAGRAAWRRFLPLAVLVAGFVLFFLTGLNRYLSFGMLREQRETLRAFVHDHAALAAAAYMVVYALVAAFSVPGGAVTSITGGFLFGATLGTLYIVLGAGTGATVLFLVAKTSLGDPLLAKAGPWLKRMEEGFRENALSYLLVLRLVPLFPFFVVNLVPAFLGVPLGTYMLGTYFGIIPGAFVYASVGAGLGSILDQGGKLTARGVLTPQVVIALVGLAVLSLIPVAYKKWRARRTG